MRNFNGDGCAALVHVDFMIDSFSSINMYSFNIRSQVGKKKMKRACLSALYKIQ